MIDIYATISRITRGTVAVLLPRRYTAIPEQVWALLEALLRGLPSMVSAMRAATELTGTERLDAVVQACRAYIDDHADDIPGWSELSEGARDRILAGVAELVYQIASRTLDEPELDEDQVQLLVSSYRRADPAPLGSLIPLRMGSAPQRSAAPTLRPTTLAMRGEE